MLFLQVSLERNLSLFGGVFESESFVKASIVVSFDQEVSMLVQCQWRMDRELLLAFISFAFSFSIGSVILTSTKSNKLLTARQ